MNEKLLIHALIISDSNGRFLVDVVRNEKLETSYLSGFISALRMFGEETLGKIKDISINGLDIDMIIVSKHGLIMIAIMDSNIPHLDFREGCGRALEVFYKIFGDKIEDWNGSLDTFRDFKDLLNGQIQRYFKELEDHKKEKDISFEELEIKIQSTEDKKFESLKEEILRYNKQFFEGEVLNIEQTEYEATKSLINKDSKAIAPPSPEKTFDLD